MIEITLKVNVVFENKFKSMNLYGKMINRHFTDEEIYKNIQFIKILTEGEIHEKCFKGNKNN